MARKNVSMTGDASKCSACWQCQMMCSYHFEDEFSATKARLSIHFGDDGNPCEITFDEECDNCGICFKYCPTHAIEIVKHA